MKANPVFSLYIPTKLVFGCGEIKKLSSEKLPGKKKVGLITNWPSIRATRTSEIGPPKGMSETANAAEAANPANASGN